MKILAAFGQSSAKHLQEYGEVTDNLGLFFKHPDLFGLVTFPGGADIDPAIYGHKANYRSYFTSRRDRLEERIALWAIAHSIPCVGICRGAQLLCAVSGGYLYQDVSDHHSDHMMRTDDGQLMRVTSCHHQMMGMPLPSGARLLGWASPGRSDHYSVGNTDEIEDVPAYEPEVAYFGNTNSLGVQYHPEWMSRGAPAVRYYLELVETLLFKRDEAVIERTAIK